MARLTVVYGEPRQTVVYPAAAEELSKLLGCDVSGAPGLSPDLEQDHRTAAALDSAGNLAGDIAIGHEFAVSLDTTAGLDGSAALIFDAGASLAAASALAVNAVQTHRLAAAADAAADFAGDVESEAAAGDPAFRVAVLTYTGDGQADHAITGAGFQPAMVWCIERDNTSAAERWIFDRDALGPGFAWEPDSDDPTWSQFTIDYSLVEPDGGITSFDADGFTLGADARMNASGTEYIAICFKEGEGAETPNFQVLDKPNTDNSGEVFDHDVGTTPVWAISKLSDVHGVDWIAGFGFAQDGDPAGAAPAAQAEGVQAASADDITLGFDNQWNSGSGSDPLYLFGGEEASGHYKSGTYTGTGSDGNAITGLGFHPSLVIVRSADGAGICVLAEDLQPQTAFDMHTGDREGSFSLDADGFTVDGAGAINRSGETFRYFAWV